MRGEVNNTVAMRDGWQRTISKRTASAVNVAVVECMVHAMERAVQRLKFFLEERKRRGSLQKHFGGEYWMSYIALSRVLLLRLDEN